LPSEVIWNDIGLDEWGGKSFQVYWVKFEGIDQRRFRNRKYVPIEGTEIRFNALKMSAKAQSRRGPTGADLPDDFVLSDRYFVHTWRNFTSLGNMPSLHSGAKRTHLSVFMNEYQDLQEADAVQLMEGPASETPVTNRPAVRPKWDERSPLQTMLIGSFASVYDRKSQMLKSEFLNYSSRESMKVQPMSATPKSGGCGCSRKAG
jgi:hypothetical protein